MSLGMRSGLHGVFVKALPRFARSFCIAFMKHGLAFSSSNIMPKKLRRPDHLIWIAFITFQMHFLPKFASPNPISALTSTVIAPSAGLRLYNKIWCMDVFRVQLLPVSLPLLYNILRKTRGGNLFSTSPHISG